MSDKSKKADDHAHHDELDAPASAATAVALVAKLGLSEREARALLDAPDISEAELGDALKANLHGIAAAFSEPVVEALLTDPKIELPQGVTPDSVRSTTTSVRLASAAIDKIEAVHGTLAASAQRDAGILQQLVYDVMPQLAARARLNASVRKTYAPLFAYHHVRNPGRHGASSPPKGSDKSNLP